MKVVVVVPTYNEQDNIGAFLTALTEQFEKDKSDDWNVLVVDGNSQDDTQKIVQHFSSKDHRVSLLIEKQKNGLGAAYAYGFTHAMKEMNADIIVEMDADFQHRPEDVLRLVAEINKGADYVIASRFVKGGTIPASWGLNRKFFSIGGNLFSKLVLGIFSLNDFTSGFKAARVKGFLDKIDFSTIRSKGFAYKIDFVYRFHKLGAKIKEIPIAFGLRDRGDSKMESNNASDSLRVVLSIALQERKSFIKFLIVGFTGLFVDTLSFNILRVVLAHSGFAVVCAGLFGMLTTFILNNFWSFGERKIEGTANKLKGVVIYILISLVPIILRSQLVHFVTLKFGDTFLISNLAFFVGIMFGLIWNYTMYSRIIWRKKHQN